MKGKFVPHHVATGALARIIALLEDLTEPRRLEKERDRLSQQRTAGLEAMGDAFLALDATWNVRLLNRQFEELVGKPREELEGRDLRDVFPGLRGPDSEYFEAYQHCMVGRAPVKLATHSPVVTNGSTCASTPRPTAASRCSTGTFPPTNEPRPRTRRWISSASCLAS